jgi:hypothetical protein
MAEGVSRDKLKLSLVNLAEVKHALCPLQLLSCDGGVGRGVNFSKSSVQVAHIEHCTDVDKVKYLPVYTFNGLFQTGFQMLVDLIEFEEKPEAGNQLHMILDTLLKFIPKIKGTVTTVCLIESLTAD